MLLHLILACTHPTPTDTAGDPVDSTAPDSADTGDTGAVDTDTAPLDSETATETDTPPPPVDEDGDGSLSGVDCDDSRADVHPGAMELCDAIDHDCDGSTLVDELCSEVQDLTLVGEVFPKRDLAISTMISDLDGDGYAEFISGTSAENGVAVYRGGSPASTYDTSPDDADETFVVEGYVMAHDYDIDGDKVEDVLFVGAWDWIGVKAAAGPFELDGAVHNLDYVETYWDNSSYDSEWLASGYTTGDFDGDGKTDFTAVEIDSEPYPWANSVWFGGSPGQPLVKLGNPDPYYASDLINMGDLDGDGGDDLLVESQWDDLYFVSGGDLRTSNGAPLADVAMGVVYEQPDWPGMTDHMFRIDDVNDDGLADVAVTLGTSSRGPAVSGEVFILDGGTFSGEMDLLDVRASFVMPAGVSCDPAADYVVPSVTMVDAVDVDGVSGREAWMGFSLCDPTHNTWLVPLRGDGQVQEWDSWLAFDGLNFLSSSGDADGDGRTDLLIRTSKDIDTYNLWYGWDVPWDEPQWWAPPE